MSDQPVSRRRVLLNGLRKRCPRCGRGPLFRSWYTLFARCTDCGLDIEPTAGDTWGFMYLTTAGLTGVIIVGMMLIQPPSQMWGAVAVLAVAVVLILGTLPRRKALAIAFDYLTRRTARRNSPPVEEDYHD